MRVHWLQHAEHEDLGCIAPWLVANGHSTTCTRLQHGQPLPADDDFDWLIVLGGPMNIYQTEEYPWLIAEKQFIGRALADQKRVLGICLGAQLIADVLGASTVKNPDNELGWHSLALSAEGCESAALLGFPETFDAFHWHGDTFAIPEGCETLMHSVACANQAFACGSRVVGIQFHLEVTAANVRDWFAVEQPTPNTYVQTPEEILPRLSWFAESNRLMEQLLDTMAA